MKPIRIDESEKFKILNLHKCVLVEEETSNKTIADIQKLLGLKSDNQLGPQTLAAIKTKLAQPSKTTTDTTTPSTQTTKTELPSDFGQTTPIQMGQVKVSGLKVDGGKVTGVETSAGKPKGDEKSTEATDSQTP